MKPKTREEIANDLGISTSTLRRWFKKKNIHLDRGLVTNDDLIMIYKKLGMSTCLEKFVNPSLQNGVSLHSVQ